GMGLDYSRVVSDRSSVQNAMDAALLAAMTLKHTPDEQIKYAYQMFDGNMLTSDAKIISVEIEHEGDNILAGKATGSTETTLMHLAGFENVGYAIESKAIRGPQEGNPLCIMAMHPTRKHTLELKGSVSIYGPKCHIYGNSNHVDDVVDPHTPDNFVTGASVTAVGYGHHYIQNVTPPLEGSTAVVADPYLSMTLPSVGACDHTGMKISGGTVTLNPGTYCNGLQIVKGADVKLNPGTYTILGSEFEVEDSKVSGTGVTLYLADRHAEFNVSKSEIKLVAPVSGTWTSFVLLSKRVENEWTFENATLDLYGIVYAPNSAVSWTNNGTPTITAAWAAWITDGFSWDGNGTINFPYDTEKAVVPHPSKLNVIPRPSLMEVVRLLK
ncbi:DUF7305 domain-containing protein, partial [Zhengella mangrovi]